MYELNDCSPIWNQTPVGGFNVHVVRMLLITSLLLLSLLYLIISLLLRKAISNMSEEDASALQHSKQMLYEVSFRLS